MRLGSFGPHEWIMMHSEYVEESIKRLHYHYYYDWAALSSGMTNATKFSAKCLLLRFSLTAWFICDFDAHLFELINQTTSTRHTETKTRTRPKMQINQNKIAQIFRLAWAWSLCCDAMRLKFIYYAYIHLFSTHRLSDTIPAHTHTYAVIACRLPLRHVCVLIALIFILQTLLQVSWVRHRDIHLLTVGRYTYTSDQRFKAIHHAHSEDWILQIKYPQHRDSGIYECQVMILLPLIRYDICVSVCKH